METFPLAFGHIKSGAIGIILAGVRSVIVDEQISGEIL